MPASTFNWKVPAGRALEAALNRALALDPETRDALRPLDGHAVVLQLDAPPVGKVKMSGDAELARRLQRLADRFDPDWQLPFVHVFGDVAGVQVAKAVGAALRQARIVGRNVAESAAEYVTEESRDVVGKAELHAFHDDVDGLRDDVERLAARVNRMKRGAGA